MSGRGGCPARTGGEPAPSPPRAPTRRLWSAPSRPSRRRPRRRAGRSGPGSGRRRRSPAWPASRCRLGRTSRTANPACSAATGGSEAPVGSTTAAVSGESTGEVGRHRDRRPGRGERVRRTGSASRRRAAIDTHAPAAPQASDAVTPKPAARAMIRPPKRAAAKMIMPSGEPTEQLPALQLAQPVPGQHNRKGQHREQDRLGGRQVERRRRGPG